MTLVPAENETVPHAMKCLQVKLVFSLDRHETHSGSLDRFGNHLRVYVIVFLRLDKRPDELSRYQSHVVPMVL
jgi:hypothetical protein